MAAALVKRYTYNLGLFLGPGFARGFASPSDIAPSDRFVPVLGPPGPPFFFPPSVGTCRVFVSSTLTAGFASELDSVAVGDALAALGIEADDGTLMEGFRVTCSCGKSTRRDDGSLMVMIFEGLGFDARGAPVGGETLADGVAADIMEGGGRWKVGGIFLTKWWRIATVVKAEF